MIDYLDKDNFFNLVFESLETKTPFAFTRFSDGEILLLACQNYDNDDYKRIIKHLWGYLPTAEQTKELANYLIEALRNSDIIGFPTERHLAREDSFGKAVPVFNKYVGKLDNCNFTSVDVAYDLLYADMYKDLLQDQEVVNIVSCRDLAETLQNKYNIGRVNQYLIPPEAKFTSGYTGENHYPHHFKKIQTWIKEMDCTGQLCLVGGGVPSKIYNIWFKMQGGISLDIGAVFCSWAGKKVRGQGRGLDVEDLQYKL